MLHRSLALLALHAGACVELPRAGRDPGSVAVDAGAAPEPPPPCPQTSPSALETAPDAGGALSLLTWNVEWLGHATEGPADDDGQYAAVRDVLRSEQADLIALQELVSEPAFERLLQDMPGRAGVLSGYDAPQKTALVWDRARFELRSARPVSGFDDAGRPPLEVVLEDRGHGTALRVVVIHAKAQADVESRARRERLSNALHAYLATREDRRLVLGDFNDQLVGSIVAGTDTPYRAFMSDERYFALTRSLNELGAREGSYAFGGSVDHVLLGEGAAPAIELRVLNVLRDELLARFPSYLDQVSDHFPVTATIVWR